VQAKATHDDVDDNDDSLDDVKCKISSSIHSLPHFTRTCLYIKPLLRGTNALWGWSVPYQYTGARVSRTSIPACVTEFLILHTAKINIQIYSSFRRSTLNT
jgi:hypothetical protein